MRIQHVDINYVNQIWPQVEKFIEAALAYQDDYNVEHAKVYVTNGTWTLIVALDDVGNVHGAATVMFYMTVLPLLQTFRMGMQSGH